MAQEFHVVRCFSCQTFQVHQVKKSKKWSCKMCGEKQSLIKEYGRGTGADCRRHVQKLNSLRGELLEVEHERARTQWEKEEECEGEVGPGDEMQKSCEQKGQAPDVSRWSKYVEQKENEPGCEDEHEEEDNVYTDKEQYRQRNNIRKRKKSFTSGVACGRYSVGGHEDTDTACGGYMGQDSQPRPHDGVFKPLPPVPRSSSGLACTSTSLRTDAPCDPPSASLGSKRITAYNNICSKPNSANKPQLFAPSFSHQHPSKSKQKAGDSKWSRFLPSVCVDGDSDEHAPYVNVDHSALVESQVMPVATVALRNTDCMSSGGSERAEIVSYCVNGNVCKQPNSPAITSRPVSSQKPVCVQPLPIKRPCPTAFSFSTLFHTDEDFDDTY